jgi:hypothetical protein
LTVEGTPSKKLGGDKADSGGDVPQQWVLRVRQVGHFLLRHYYASKQPHATKNNHQQSNDAPVVVA